MSEVLIVDDEPTICHALQQALTDRGHCVSYVSSVEEASESIAEKMPHAIMLDIRLPGLDGLSFLKTQHKQFEETSVIVMTAFGDLESAIEAFRNGAFEYLTKPFDLATAVNVVERALDQPKVQTVEEDRPTLDSEFRLIGKSPPMQSIFRQIALVADRLVPVLITGESGTGKEMIATAIHQFSDRSEKPFVPISIPALSPALIESELFGYEKGAFTGADVGRIGMLEQAGSGTVFLDEIGDIPLSTQVKLLRVLDTKRLTPVGSNESRSIHCRIVAATNRHLEQLIAEELFREDLYYRFNVFRIDVPPLRKRVEDIPALAEHFLRVVDPMGQHTLLPETIRDLEKRPWHGNVRELKNAVDYATVVARGSAISPYNLPRPLEQADRSGEDLNRSLIAAVEEWIEKQFAQQLDGEETTSLYERFLDICEPILLERTLRESQGNRQETARLLGIHRQTLRAKMKKHRLG